MVEGVDHSSDDMESVSSGIIGLSNTKAKVTNDSTGLLKALNNLPVAS